ncbi:MAG: lysophospholipid acyltransferase family protein [Oligoflexia bacterium]|nr:lysophospholipid acyltransferase family protein [Oligoflexia bacterium]
MDHVMGVLMAGLGWFFYWMPTRLRFWFSDALGALLWQLGFRKEVVVRNLSLAYPKDPARQKALVREGYRHLARLAVEIFFLFGPMPRFARKSVRIEGEDNLRRALSEGHGGIFLSSHVGNWEVMAASSVQISGLRVLLVTKHLQPEWLHRLIERARALCNVSATYEPKTLRDVMRHLKSGQIVGFVLDQYAGPPVGMRVPVFGIPVGTTTAVAMLARRTGAPVLPVVNYRCPDGTYRVEIRPALSWETSPTGDKTEELGINTARYASVLEKDIYAHPDQWLWTHRRFKGDLSPLRPGEWREGRPRH